MLISQPAQCICELCGRHKLANEMFTGRLMWHELRFTCRHTMVYVCPDCGDKDWPACPECGREEVYT